MYRGILIMLALLTGGCSTLNGYPDRPAKISVPGGSSKTPEAAEEEALANYHSSDTSKRWGLTKGEYRDAFVRRAIAADDDSFSDFSRKLRSQRAVLNIGSDAAVIAINGVAAVTGGAETKAALAVGSAAILGVRSSIDKEIFDQQALGALVARMKAARLAALVPISAGMAKSDKDYPLEQALIDLRAYADAGSLLSAIDAINSDAGLVAAQATEQIKEITRDTTYRDSRIEVDGLRNRLKALTDDQSLKLLFVMQRYASERSKEFQDDLQQQNPSNSRFRNPKAAHAFLLYWLEQESGKPGELKQWFDSIDLIEKNG
jgi:hypothetical protein